MTWFRKRVWQVSVVVPAVLVQLPRVLPVLLMLERSPQITVQDVGVALEYLRFFLLSSFPLNFVSWHPCPPESPQNSVDSLLRALGREYLFGDRSVQITLLYSNLLLLLLMFTVCLIRTLLDRLALHYGQVVWIVWLFISLSVQTLINVHSVWTRGWSYFAYFH